MLCRRGKRGDRAEGKKDDGTMQPPRFGFAVEKGMMAGIPMLCTSLSIKESFGHLMCNNPVTHTIIFGYWKYCLYNHI